METVVSMERVCWCKLEPSKRHQWIAFLTGIFKIIQMLHDMPWYSNVWKNHCIISLCVAWLIFICPSPPTSRYILYIFISEILWGIFFQILTRKRSQKCGSQRFFRHFPCSSFFQNWDPFYDGWNPHIFRKTNLVVVLSLLYPPSYVPWIKHSSERLCERIKHMYELIPGENDKTIPSFGVNK